MSWVAVASRPGLVVTGLAAGYSDELRPLWDAWLHSATVP